MNIKLSSSIITACFWKSSNIFTLIFIFLFLFSVSNLAGQVVTYKEEYKTIKTYPFSDANPIPTLGINNKVGAYYPYYMFNGYTDKPFEKDWKVITLENKYIIVTILPGVGGKVMGAIEKSTGKEFIYENHVMKFRAIGIRGPWTSGGIEHNFGLDLGHAPWTASDVDYVVKENEDGSVSCIVGGLDLASRSQWRVDIRLPKDKAYFETRSMWFNPMPLNDAYLSWEISVYKGTDDLQFYFPGQYFVGHDGDVHSWPIDKAQNNLSLYKENNFGTSKSYHVGGVFPNWFGGYFHNSEFGSGHWSSYDDAPGKKLWIWSLARDGAIWEDLLTDSDGQYIEAQSGVKLNQASPESGFNTPYNQLFMRPFYTETKTDYWFPVKETGGMIEASPAGTLNLDIKKEELKISFSPNININDTLVVKSDGEIILSELIKLEPMQVYKKTIRFKNNSNPKINVSIGPNLLNYTSDIEEIKIDRPTITPKHQDYTSAEHLYRQAEDMYSMRNYLEALKTYQECLKKEPTHSRALAKIAEINYRMNRFEEGLKYARKALGNNIYDPEANFIYGVLHKALGNLTNAKEAFSISVRSMEYRSASYVELSGLFLQTKNFSRAKKYAQMAIDFNKYNISAYEQLITSNRKLKQLDDANKVINLLLDIDPLNHYARFENYLINPTSALMAEFKNNIQNEFPSETYLELGISYYNLGLNIEAIKLLEEAPDYPIIKYWLAYLNREKSTTKSHDYLMEAVNISPEFVFPFRLETIPVLTWAISKNKSWKNSYYLGLIYWKLLQTERAIELFNSSKNTSDYAVFYTTRGILLQNYSSQIENAGDDFKKALSINDKEWRAWYYLVKHYEFTGNLDQQFEIEKKMSTNFPMNSNVGISYAQVLLNVNKNKECLKVLSEVNVMPGEFSNSGHGIYEMANISIALDFIANKKYKKAINYLNESKKYPENLGTGKPYEPDYRLQNYLLIHCENKLNNQRMTEEYAKQIIDYSEKHWNDKENIINAYISALTLTMKGKSNQAEELMKNWHKSQEYKKNWKLSSGTDSAIVQWVIAKYKNDLAKINTLEKEFNKSNNKQMTILIRALDLVKKD